MPLPPNTEFYLSLLPIVTGLILVLIGAIKGDMTMIQTGIAAMGATSGAYSLARGIAKITSTGADGRTPSATAIAVAPPATSEDAARVIAALPLK